MTPYTIRNYQSADFDKYVLLRQEAEKLEPYRRQVSPQAITERLSKPGYSPERDLFVVTMAGSLVGYTDVIPELGIGRVILSCWVHPEHRRKGLTKELLGHAMHHAREAGASAAHVNIAEDNAIAKTVLSRLGFKFVRRFLEYKLDMSRLGWPEASQAVRESRRLRSGEEDKLTRIQNLSFAEHWGYDPNTVATTAYRINLSHHSPEDVFLAYESDKIIGFCWTETISERQGRIFMLGTDPDYRGRGIGRRLLLAGLAHLKNKGTQVAVLTVDSKNESACALYRSVGFELQSSSLWYEKKVAQETGAS